MLPLFGTTPLAVAGVGRAGMTEARARASERPLLVGTRPMGRVSRAIEKGETAGLMKVVDDAETRRILGAAILGTGGYEAIHGVLDIMNAGVLYDRLERAVPIDPTVSEPIPTVLGELQPDGALNPGGGRPLQSDLREGPSRCSPRAR